MHVIIELFAFSLWVIVVGAQLKEVDVSPGHRSVSCEILIQFHMNLAWMEVKEWAFTRFRKRTSLIGLNNVISVLDPLVSQTHNLCRTTAKVKHASPQKGQLEKLCPEWKPLPSQWNLVFKRAITRYLS